MWKRLLATWDKGREIMVPISVKLVATDMDFQSYYLKDVFF